MKVIGVKSINLKDVYFPTYSKNVGAESVVGGTQLLPNQQDIQMTIQDIFVIG